MHRNWKLGHSTHSVADTIVDASTSSEGLSRKTHFDGYHAALLNKTKFHALVAVGVIHLGFDALFGQA